MRCVAPDLPDDPQERRALLDAYFSRRLTEATRRTDGRWDVEVRPFDDAGMLVDPDLTGELPSWGVEDVGALPRGARIARRSLFAFEDSWTAVSWSRCMPRLAGEEHVVILHVDDHDDLMAPLLAERAGELDDLVTGEPLTLDDVEAVTRSVIAGSISVAGFFTPFLHTLSGGSVRHLCASGYSNTRTGRRGLRPTWQVDDLLAVGRRRPAIEITPTDVAGAEPWSYEVTSNPAEWVAGLSDTGPVLLHIDLDYFCNRFNGDSDWRTNPARNDVGLFTALKRVDAMCEALTSPLVARVVDVSVALSPGFFPSSMWRPVVSRLARGLSARGLDVDALIGPVSIHP